MGVGVRGLGQRVESLGFRVWGLGLGSWDLGLGVQGVKFRVKDLPRKLSMELRVFVLEVGHLVSDFGIRVQSSDLVDRVSNFGFWFSG